MRSSILLPSFASLGFRLDHELAGPQRRPRSMSHPNGVTLADVETQPRQVSLAATHGFFSLIQYCPDLDRGESADVGVVLLVPALGFFGVRFSDDNEGPKQRFGEHSIDDTRLDVAKRTFEGASPPGMHRMVDARGPARVRTTRRQPPPPLSPAPHPSR